MLYLIKEYGGKIIKIKIGKADNINKRMQQYNTDCAEFELIDTFEGSIPEENLLHSFLEKYKVKGEWMEYNEEIFLLWKLYKELRPKVKETILQHEHYVTENQYNTQIKYYKDLENQYKEKLENYSSIIEIITTILKKKFNANTLEEVLEKLENKNIIL